MLAQTTSSKIYSNGDYKRLSDRIRKNPKLYEVVAELRMIFIINDTYGW